MIRSKSMLAKLNECIKKESSLKLIEGRECGDCSICCKELDIDSDTLTKPAGQMCSNRTAQGCSIYPERPSLCRQWFCAWRWFPFADHVRPDKSDILMSYELHPMFKRDVMVVRDISDNQRAFEQPGFEFIIISMLNQGIEVWCSTKDKPMYRSTSNAPF